MRIVFILDDGKMWDINFLESTTVWSAVQGPLWCCVCIINSYSTLLNWPIVRLLILFILFSIFFVLIHDCTLCFIGSPCCNFSYYNYISIWPYYIIIHLVVGGMIDLDIGADSFDRLICHTSTFLERSLYDLYRHSHGKCWLNPHVLESKLHFHYPLV